MFIRVKTTPNSPRKSVQIVKSVRNKNKVSQKIIRHIGIAMDDDELEKLKFLAETIRIKLENEPHGSIFSPEEVARATYEARKQEEGERRKKKEEKKELKKYNVNLQNIIEEDRVISGIHDVYGKLFDELEIGSIIKKALKNKKYVNILKEVVLARIADPQSKRASADMLEKKFGVSLKLDEVYKMMDKIDDKAIERLNRIIESQTKDLFGGKVDILFYDCTTIYFESFEEDELRKNGFSKDLKFNQPQVLLSLIVTKEGLPLGYEVFSGETYEGSTLVPAIKKLKRKYEVNRIIIVADAGMFNKENLKEIEKIEEPKVEYIVGARLKNLKKELQREVVKKEGYENIEEGYKIKEIEYEKEKRLIVSYREGRARKDAIDREKAIEKMRKKLNKNKNPKEYLNNYGYKKYLKVEGESKLIINEKKIEEEKEWDGLHGVITNAKGLSGKEILSHYNNLWEVENGFRVTKHDLKIRPVFHWKPRRVKAHIAIAFICYALVKHLQYRVGLQYKKLSPEKIRQTLIQVQTTILYNTTTDMMYGIPSKVSVDVPKIYKILNIKRMERPFIINSYKRKKQE